jgi:hypothetical protein
VAESLSQSARKLPSFRKASVDSKNPAEVPAPIKIKAVGQARKVRLDHSAVAAKRELKHLSAATFHFLERQVLATARCCNDFFEYWQNRSNKLRAAFSPCL